ncbi:MAG: cytochrome c biogenesis heme-transporting ATPase CcmA [Burkholderiaceae bacterium]|jgi:heme exporter protein A|nr:cytochrome c biogenesis heme-transporting ATPase CcmA [Polynucleobacter sp.]NCA09974.1 cytochrome c biogenesis heme-transporting ATPase CcmA [Burkholderiaceae bacterium]NCV65246.1 cytochrome c biogenesis heme-transporting ATPase CcmA [Burkholderiaceae bacterium]NCX67180.1 cytochrome c biogenesis heme-transporting ATPase CcmA [Burkholderiaceae bacterium]NDA02560.1 cytochrome c biogenesis heme-transporting ATPase CcmA [Burkholderiaceae bacterium]
MRMSKSLRLESITCVRGDRTLFEELNLEIKPGSILRISGDNGSGKSSLLRILCGLLTPHAGKVFWGSDPITEDRDQFHGELIYLGHIPALKADFSAIENLMSLALLGGQSISNEEAMNALREAGLDRQAHRFIRTLSQGQKQRIALSRLLLPQPKSIWILDEPFNALDRDANRALQNLLINHVNRGGIVALSSHQDLQIDDNARVIRLEL